MMSAGKHVCCTKSRIGYVGSKLHHYFLAFVVSVSLCGCSVVPVPPPDNKYDVYQQSSHNEVKIKDGGTTRSIALAKLIAVIAPNKVIGRQTYGLLGNNATNIRWDALNQRITMESLPGAFNDKVKKLNYNVIGGGSNLFEDRKTPDLAVGAVVTDITHNLNVNLDIFNRSVKHEDISISIDWQVYDTFQQQVVYKKSTVGRVKVDAFQANSPYADVVSRAFTDALGYVLEDKEFTALVAEGHQSESKISDSQSTGTLALDGVHISRFKPNMKKKALSEIRKSVITVQVGNSHGSGFVVSEEGLIITNKHVVSDASSVRVIAYDGRTVEANVIKVNNERDVAILLAKDLHMPALVVNDERLSIGSEVFAIGSPKDIKFSGTVTNGIISSYREIKNMEWIQSNAVINPGSSGGPLVDGNGSAIGIATRLLRDANGIYFYIPIGDAISSLGVRLR